MASKSEGAAGEEPKREELAPNRSLEAVPKMSADAGFVGLGDASEATGALRSTAAVLAGASNSAALAPPPNRSAVAADLAGFAAPRPRGSKSEEEDAGLVSFTSSETCVYVSKGNNTLKIRSE